MKKTVDEQTAHILESLYYFIDVPRRELVQFFVMSKYYHRDINRAQHGKLMSLLEKPTFAFEESAMRGELAGRTRRINSSSIIVVFLDRSVV